MTAEWPAVDKTSTTPLTEQIADHYERAIRGGRLAGGQRLPTIRDVSARACVTRATVQQAYRRLAQRGLVEATVGRGTLVRSEAALRDPIAPGARAAVARLRRTGRRHDGGEPVVANFAQLLPDSSGFPVDEFRRSLGRVLDADGRELLGYGEPDGSRALRSVLARWAGGADPERIVVTHGAQQGIDLALSTFAHHGDAVACIVPTYHQLFGMFEAHGLRVVPIVARDDGSVDADELGAALQSVRALCVMPTFHNPTGHTMTREQRDTLIRIVADTDVPVIEDEVECALRFRGEPLPSLGQLDPRGLTVTVRSFSKGLFPGVRIGWVESEPEVLAPLAALKRYSDLETSPLLQAAVLDFIEAGGVDAYLTKLRAELAARHAAAQDALAEHLSDGCRWTRPDGGFTLWVRTDGVDGDRLAEACAARGVLVTPGRVFDPLDRPSDAFRLSVARADCDEVGRGIALLGECAEELAGRTTQPPLFL